MNKLEHLNESAQALIMVISLLNSLILYKGQLLHRNSTVARMVTKVTSEHYGNP